MSEIFAEYRFRGGSHKGSPVAAVQVQRDNIAKLAQITGGVAMTRQVSGGSLVYDQLIIHGPAAKVGDYVIADKQDSFIIVSKEFFEKHWELKGPVRT